MKESDPIPASISTGKMAGFWGTKIPGTVAFGLALLLFFMPFLEIKCNSITLQKVSGAQLATGFEIKGPGSDDSVVGSFDKMNTDHSRVSHSRGKNDPNVFALLSLVLGVVGFVMSLIDKKGALTSGVISGILGTVSLIATLIDVKRKVKMDLPEMTGRSSNTGSTDLEKLGDSMYIAVDFTAWYYITVLVFVVATWLCFKRMQRSYSQ